VHAFHHAARDHEARHFCARCGTTLFWFESSLPEPIGVAGGCFADQGLPEPVYSVTDDNPEPWVTLPGTWKVWALKKTFCKPSFSLRAPAAAGGGWDAQ
jgi:hypothetical protein